MSPGAGPDPAGLSLEREVDLLRHAVGLLRERLPSDWGVKITEDPEVRGRRVDAVVELTGSGDTRGLLVMEAKRAVLIRDLPSIVNQIRSHITRFAKPGTSATPVVVARYLSPSTREWLERESISYIDATGNLRIAMREPTLYLRDRGADKDPWRGPGRLRGSLRGPPAARVVRALVDFAPPVTVPVLVRRSGASTGATYRVVDFLEQEGLIERESRGPITAVDWRRLLERWSDDYSFQHSNVIGRYLQPRGIPALLDALRGSTRLSYALSGSLAAERVAPYAPPRLAMLYVDDPAVAVGELDLRAVDSGVNVLLATSDYEVVFDRVTEVDGLVFVALSQAAVDLRTAPGRGPVEADALLDWMQHHESAWRQ